MELLVISDQPGVVETIRRGFHGATVEVTPSLAAAQAHLLGRTVPAAVVAVHPLPDGDATTLLEGMASSPPFPLVLLTATPDEREAVEVIKAGALDYLPLNAATLTALPHIVRGVRREYLLARRAEVAEDRLRHANRLIGTGRLAAVTAHEVGTPLNVARMQAQILAASDDATPQMLEGCARIVEQLDIVAERLGGMLDYARVGTPGRSVLSLSEAVESAVVLLRPLAVRQGVTLSLDVVEQVVHANRTQVQQVVFNLLANALHAIDRDGTICVLTRSENRNGDVYGVVEVRDDGPGVAPSIQDHLFDAFFTTKAAGRGTGLGLAVSRDIAAAHGGWLECTSEPGATSFSMGLPSTRPQTNASKTAE